MPCGRHSREWWCSWWHPVRRARRQARHCRGRPRRGARLKALRVRRYAAAAPRPRTRNVAPARRSGTAASWGGTTALRSECDRRQRVRRRRGSGGAIGRTYPLIRRRPLATLPQPRRRQRGGERGWQRRRPHPRRQGRGDGNSLRASKLDALPLAASACAATLWPGSSASGRSGGQQPRRPAALRRLGTAGLSEGSPRALAPRSHRRRRRGRERWRSEDTVDAVPTVALMVAPCRRRPRHRWRRCAGGCCCAALAPEAMARRRPACRRDGG